MVKNCAESNIGAGIFSPALYPRLKYGDINDVIRNQYFSDGFG